jgi:hypothetical protein
MPEIFPKQRKIILSYANIRKSTGIQIIAVRGQGFCN